TRKARRTATIGGRTVGSARLARPAPVAWLVPEPGGFVRCPCQQGREFRASGRRAKAPPAEQGPAASAAAFAPCRTTSSRNRHESPRCVVGTRRQKLYDALAEKALRCVVGSQLVRTVNAS